MIAPVAYEDVNFPDQKDLNWTRNESLQFRRAQEQTFTSQTGVTYDPNAISIGPSYGGSLAKWAGGALANDGKIYALGHDQDSYLVIDTYTDNVSTTGSISPTDPKNNSSVYSPYTNCVYSDADDGIYKFDVATSTYSYVTKPYSGRAVMLGQALDGSRIYFHGFFSSRKMYYYDILTDTITDTGVTWTGDRITGALSWNNKFYLGGGGGSTNFLVYDVDSNTATTITGGSSIGADQFRNFIMHPATGNMYTFGGFGSDVIKMVDPVTDTVYDVGTQQGNANNFNDYCIGADGYIYAIGQGNVIGQFDVFTNTFNVFGFLPEGSWEGITMGALGDLYAIPWNSQQVAKIPILNKNEVTGEFQQSFNGITARFQAP